MIDFRTVTAFDVETGGKEDLFPLQPFRMLTGEAWLNSCAIALFRGGALVSRSRRKPTAAWLARWLDTVAGRYVVAWNTPFDISWLLVLDKLHPHLGIREKVFRVNWLDGMLLYRHWINAPRYKEEGRESVGLKEAVAKIYPAEAGYEKGIVYDPQTEEEWEDLLGYNEDDCRYTLRILAYLLARLPESVVRCAIIEARCLPLVADTKIDGLLINADKARDLSKDLIIKRDAALVQLCLEHGMLEWQKIIASPKQLRELLYDQWKLPVPHLTETYQPSTDKEALTILGLTDPRANLIYTVRECQTRETKFATGALDSITYNGDGRARPDFRVFGTYTGRGTYSSKQGKGKAQRPTGIAIHQWVNDPVYRSLIEVDEDSELIEADFSGQEFRWMAVESGDPVMLDLCLPGQDAHAFMGHRIQPEHSYEWIAANREEDPVAKKIRKLGKVGNLSAQYRTGPKTLMKVAAVQHGVKLDFRESELVIYTYRKTYRRVPRYWNRQIQFAKRHGYVETMAGRRVNLGDYKNWRFFDEETKITDDMTWAHESTAINFPIQGVGADQKYLALLVIRNYLPTIGGRFLMELHDGIFFRVPKGMGERAARDIKRLLSNLPYKRAWNLRHDLPIQFPVDVKRGPSWGALKELH
jgi:DNA polymerase-1